MQVYGCHASCLHVQPWASYWTSLSHKQELFGNIQIINYIQKLSPHVLALGEVDLSQIPGIVWATGTSHSSVSHSVVSDSLRTCGLWPTRLLCPWDSPGKNTGVDFHSLLQSIFPTQGSNPGFLHCRQILYIWATGKILTSHSTLLIKVLCTGLNHEVFTISSSVYHPHTTQDMEQE